jgi:hypothetical protein
MELNEILDTGVAAQANYYPAPAPYYAKVLENRRIGIFTREPELLIGEYIRDDCDVWRTFHPFELRGKWYALFSQDPGYTDLMELPSCKVIWNEKRDDELRFRPIDYWVPSFAKTETRHQMSCPCNSGAEGINCTCNIMHRPECPNPHPKYQVNGCICHEEWAVFEKQRYIWHFPDRIHGFVSGYYKEFSSGYILQYLDLSRADEGIVVQDFRYGCPDLPVDLTLRQAVHFHFESTNTFTVAVLKEFSVITGDKA